PRMDFQNVVILPDGRVATSFLDSTTLSHPPGTGALGRIGPAVAIELDTTLPPLKADLVPTPLAISATKAKGGDKVTFSGNVANGGETSAPNVAVRFLVDGVAVGADRTIAEVAGGSTS